jgi:hypothetical protein
MRKNALPTGAAQPVTNTVERVRAIFKNRSEPAAPPQKERKNVRRAKAEAATEEATPRELDEPEPHQLTPPRLPDELDGR